MKRTWNRIKIWLAGRRQAFKNRLKAYLGVTDLEGRVGAQEGARRACIATDLAMQREEGFLILLLPSKGGDQVRVWRLPAGMRLDRQTEMIREFERWSRGEISLMDMPHAMRSEFKDHLHRTRRMDGPYKDSGPGRPW